MITLVTVPELLSAQHALSIDCCIACPSGQQSSRYGLPKGRAYVIKCIAGYLWIYWQKAGRKPGGVCQHTHAQLQHRFTREYDKELQLTELTQLLEEQRNSCCALGVAFQQDKGLWHAA